MAAKKIPNEEINIFLKDQKPHWFMTKINPFGVVPVIEHEGHYIRESLVAFGMSFYFYSDLINVYLEFHLHS